MNAIFYIVAAIAVISSVMSIRNRNAIHALLFLIISLLSVSIVFYILGAPLVAALEVIVYAGAIMVLFIFVVMMLNVGMEEKTEKEWLKPGMWIAPAVMATILLVILIYATSILKDQKSFASPVGPKEVGASLFSVYIIGVEIAAILLLAGVVGAYHLGRQRKKVKHRFLEKRGKVTT